MPLFFWGQSLSGLWTGVLTNDSNSVRKDQSFEIALTEYKGKVYGYSRSEFIVNDTLYYVVKRVKGIIEGDICEVKDEEIIAFNFPTKLDRGIKVSSTFYRNKTDSTWHLNGNWKTNQTKKYYSVTGKVTLKEEKDMELSRLFPHLEELNLAKDVPFYQESKKLKESIVRTAVKPEQQNLLKEVNIAGPSTIGVNTVEVANKQALRTSTLDPRKAGAVAIPTQTTAEIAKAELKEQVTREKTSINAEQQATLKEEIVLPQPAAVKINTVAVDNKPVIYSNTLEPTKAGIVGIPTQTTTAINKPALKEEIAREKTIVRTEEQPVNEYGDLVSASPTRNVPAISKPVPATSTTTQLIRSERPGNSENVVAKNTPVIHNGAAANVTNREIAPAQVINFKSDSLELSLYDNGEIDGDTVSVLLNGELFLAKQGLKASAIKKTIYIGPGSEELTLVLYAENLGKYPPNTGLLVVHDGDDVYNLRFSADLQKNAAVVFRRKK
jgi:LEA14-like dessication related protein